MLPKTPTKGMRDFLPKEFALRQHILSTIQKTYESFGFNRIETPSVENLALLTSKQGGDNEKLIFKILKRGEKLENAATDDLCDLGLRYDLTVPLARFYANNVGQLPSVFKAIQMDNVWRADRPQRGRFRQFVQCDIDIIGEPSNLAETDLIIATTSALANLGFNDVTVRISDRRLLNALAEYCGFTEQQKPSVFIALDKLDKIGVVGVLQEVEAIAPGKSENFINFISIITASSKPFEACVEQLGSYLPEEVKKQLAGDTLCYKQLHQKRQSGVRRNACERYGVLHRHYLRNFRGRNDLFRGRWRKIRQNDRKNNGQRCACVRFFPSVSSV